MLVAHSQNKNFCDLCKERQCFVCLKSSLVSVHLPRECE